jgi:cytochrome c oxidase subunit II
VVAAQDFDAWLDRRSQSAAGGGGGGGGGAGGGGQAADGEALFTANGCGSCHTLEAAGTEGTVGPSLDDITRADAGAIEESITDPNAAVVKGFPRNVMPDDFSDQLSGAELDALVKYLLEAQK